MNRLGFAKILSVLSMCLAVVVLLAVGAVASPNIKITYNYGGYVHDQLVEAGQEIVPMAPLVDEGDSFYGWADKYGNIYKTGEKASFAQDTALYLVAGPEVSTADELFDAIANGKTYIKLADDIIANQALALDNGVLIIDTNGYALDINTSGAGVTGKDTGISFIGGGAVTHTVPGVNPSFILDSFISLSPITGYNTLFITVGENTTVSTNVDFASIETNIESQKGALTVSVYGTLTAGRFLKTNGVSEATFDIYSGAVVTTNCEYLFEDTGKGSASRLVNLTMHGGTLNTDRLIGYAKDSAKYQMAIKSGSFSENLAPCFPDGNYTFTYNQTKGVYEFSKCAHSGPVVSGMPNTCTEAATLTYKCSYCNGEYTKSFPNGIGHTIVTSIEQELITTIEKTQEGIFKHYCQKCGQAEYEVFYPRPSEVYVDAIILDLKGRPEKIRVPAKELYSFDSSTTTQVNSFSAEYIQAEYNVTQERIISVEIPLGTTSIYGYIRNSVPVGAFCKNQHLEEIVIPKSVTYIKEYAFSNMQKLKTIKGLENITGTIERYAFAQDHTNVFIDQFVLNAQTVNEYAFKNIRMNSLTIGKNVTSIANGVFFLEPTIINEEYVREVIIEGCTFEKGLPVYAALRDYRSWCSFNNSGHQFGANPVAYGDHQYNVTVQEANCNQEGFTLYECKHCTAEKIEDQTPKLSHQYEKDVHILPTCLTQGYVVANKCALCGDEQGEKVVNEKRDPNAHDFSYGTAIRFMNFIEGSFILVEKGNICQNYHFVVGKCKCGAIDTTGKLPTSFSELTSPKNPNHTYDEKNYEVIKEPNCGEDGKALVTCTTCGNQEKRDLIKNGTHKWGSKTTIVKESTCSEKGVERFSCTICNSTRDRTMEKDSSNHKWGDPITLKASTESAMGIEQMSCEWCGNTTENRLPRLEAKKEIPTMWIVLIAVGGFLVIGGVVLTIVLTLTKKKRASDNYKYKFNTLGK